MRSLDQLEVLFSQLNAVKEVSDKQFWLTTDELNLLLEPEVELIDTSGIQVKTTQFQWRNFTCTWQGRQGTIHYWKIIENQSQPEVVYPVHFLQFDNALSSDEADEILSYALDNQTRFVESTTADGVNDRRQSRVLMYPDVAPLLVNKLQQLLPQIRQEYRLKEFPISKFETQLTTSSDGCFYHIHNDNGSGLGSRLITYVYYIHHQPRAYTGGQLRIYETLVSPTKSLFTHNYTHIEPVHNRLIIFPSFYYHEILPVTCPSQEFAHGRFTLNGWIHKGSEYKAAN